MNWQLGLDIIGEIKPIAFVTIDLSFLTSKEALKLGGARLLPVLSHEFTTAA